VYYFSEWNYTFRYNIRLPNLLQVATPQDNIIEALEAEIIRLKTELTHTEDRLSGMRKKFDEMSIKLYGGGRN